MDELELVEVLVGVAVAAGSLVFAVGRWTSERTTERERKRDHLAALYINPFLDACEDLQSRLYNLLERDGFTVLRRRHPDGAHAAETLHLIARYFAWEAIVFRYGPYTRDAEVIRLTEAVRDGFARSDLGLGR